MAEPDQPVKITIRKREEKAAKEDSAIFVIQFAHVKKSLSTFLKLLLMGGCGADGWAGIGELEAQHSPSGARASVEVDVEAATVSLLSESPTSADGNRALSAYAVALLDELDALARTEEAAAADRLCYPPEAVDSARLAAWAATAPRERPAETVASDETPFDKFLREIGKK